MSIQIINKLLNFFSEYISDEIEQISINVKDENYYILGIRSRGIQFRIHHIERGEYSRSGPYYLLHINKNDSWKPIKTNFHSGYPFKDGILGVFVKL